jgi:hypothetical protein
LDAGDRGEQLDDLGVRRKHELDPLAEVLQRRVERVDVREQLRDHDPVMLDRLPPVQEGHCVIRSGAYRMRRHPSYTGLLAAPLGFGIALDSWLSVIVLVGVLIRIYVEESALSSALGESYRQYAAHTRRLIPWVW